MVSTNVHITLDNYIFHLKLLQQLENNQEL